MFKIQRCEESRKREFPLIALFVYTGEELNSWRCEVCATKSQLKTASAQIVDHTVDRPECCRKCGVSF